MRGLMFQKRKKYLRAVGFYGQSVVEYIVVITILLLAVLGVRGLMQDKFNGVYRNAIQQIP